MTTSLCVSGEALLIEELDGVGAAGGVEVLLIPANLVATSLHSHREAVRSHNTNKVKLLPQ